MLTKREDVIDSPTKQQVDTRLLVGERDRLAAKVTELEAQLEQQWDSAINAALDAVENSDYSCDADAIAANNKAAGAVERLLREVSE